MFLGEILCGVVYVALRCARKGEPMPYFNPLYLAVAGMCDMTATSMMYVGLTMTYASTFQILRGVVVVFTSLFSHFVLGRKQQPFQWLGVVLVVVGTGVVGLAPFAPAPWGLPSSGSDAGASNPALGNFIIIIAQVVVGVQMCWEERYVTEYNIPALLVVGWEGLFGLFAFAPRAIRRTTRESLSAMWAGAMVEAPSAELEELRSAWGKVRLAALGGPAGPR